MRKRWALGATEMRLSLGTTHARTRPLLDRLPGQRSKSVGQSVHGNGRVDRPHQAKSDTEREHDGRRFATRHSDVEVVGGFNAFCEHSDDVVKSPGEFAAQLNVSARMQGELGLPR